MDNNTKLFVLKYFHSGKFVSSPKFDYVNYKSEKFQVDPDKLCYWDIVGNMKELGYDNDAWLYFRVPGDVFSTYALVLVVDDDAVRQIVGFLNTRGIIELYVVAGNVRGIITEVDENAVNEVVGNALIDIDEDKHEAVNEVGEKGTSQDPIGDEVADIEDLGNNTTEVEHEADEKETSQDSIEDEVLEIEYLGHSTAEVEQEAGEKQTSQDSADFLVNVEIASDLDDEVERIRVNLRADRHEISTDVSEGEENNDAECGSQPNVGNDLFKEDEDVAEVEGKLQDHESDYIESDEPGEYRESDDDYGDQICGAYMGRGKKHVGHKYDPKCAFPLCNPGSTISFQVHRDSDNKAIFHRMYICFDALKKGWKEGCRTFIGADSCYLKTATQGELLVTIGRDGNNQMFPVAWAVVEGEGNESWKWFLTKLLQDLNHPDGEGLTLMSDQQKIKCQRARLNVLREKRGSYFEEYATLWGYVAELLHSNPGSTISIQVHRDSDNKTIFHRMYICFDALKKGWKEGCRPFIGVNGCFLKTATQGELLVAIGKDGNNQMFPVAWTVVEGERKESWKWFLTKLMQDLNHPDGEGLTLMSDQQKASQSDNNARTTRSMKRKFNETEIVDVRPSVSNRKRQVGIGIYTDLRIGEQTLNPGLPSEQVVTRAAKRKIGASISQYNHASKGHGLKWRGKQAVTTRQLQQQQSDQRRQSKRRTSQNLLDTQSSQADANANN
ncbi:hypothetical protein V6N12_031470 [Hibiscus sabdariffa]|uniref:MULE transposase domain-containing protein n=1 Tax=Hibiscus sabdariffa TaxID=183260 RepID=A0ABR2CPC3_9ROSI